MASDLDGDPSGPAVDGGEGAYRAITVPEWWKQKEQRPSSAAVNWPKFSVDLASRTDPATMLCRFNDGTGLIEFNCGQARDIGFDTRDEPDREFPDNHAHAHVYCDMNASQRKKRAKRLVELSTVVAPANLPPRQK